MFKLWIFIFGKCAPLSIKWMVAEPVLNIKQSKQIRSGHCVFSFVSSQPSDFWIETLKYIDQKGRGLAVDLSTGRNKALAPSSHPLDHISICFTAELSVLCSPGLSASGMHSGITPFIFHPVSMCFEIQGEKGGEIEGENQANPF